MAARILIADDNAPVRRALRRVLERAGGWDIIEAENGKEAVAMAKETSPDLIILDLAMPEMDGFTSTREISKLMPGVPILLHTLYWSPRVVLEALKAGARKAIPKSQSNAVIAAVQELLPAREPRLIVLLHKPQAAKVVTPQQSPTDSAQESAFLAIAEDVTADPQIAGPQIAVSPKIAYSQEKDAEDAGKPEGKPRMGAKNLEDVGPDNDEQDLDDDARKVS